MTVAMIVFGALTVVSALSVVVARQPLNSALGLVATLFLVAVHFAILGAELMAALQILVYAGAIMVLVVFVIMLLGLESTEATSKKSRFLTLSGVGLSGIFVSTIFYSLSGKADFGLGRFAKNQVGELPSGFGTTEAIGEMMFTTYIVPFQLVGLLLLAAIIGAVVLAKDEKRPLPEGRGLSDKRSV